MDAQFSGNLFDSIEPHRHLPDKTRAALWAACERVRKYTYEFADAVAWLDRDYSEAEVCKRHLADSFRTCWRNLRDLAGSDCCDTLPRRLALRASRPEIPAPRRLSLLQRFRSVRELVHVQPEFVIDLSEHPEKVRPWLVQLTFQTAMGRGHRIEDGNVVQRSYAEVGEKGLPDEKTVETYWSWLDERTRARIRGIWEERRKRDERIREQSKDPMGRFWEAVRHAVEGGIPPTNRVECALRLVLLAAMIASPDPISSSAEFAALPWTDKDRPGAFWFQRYDFRPADNQWTIAGLRADEFGDQIARALAILNVEGTAGVPGKALATAVLQSADDAGSLFQHTARLCEYFRSTVIAIDAYCIMRQEHTQKDLANYTEMKNRQMKDAMEMLNIDLPHLVNELAPTGRDYARLIGEIEQAVVTLLRQWVPIIGAPSLPPESTILHWREQAEAMRKELAIRLTELKVRKAESSTAGPLGAAIAPTIKAELNGNAVATAPTQPAAAANTGMPGGTVDHSLEADSGAKEVTPPAPMKRQEAQRRAQEYVTAHGWPSSQRKLAEAVDVSRPLLDDMPGIERYKRTPSPKAVTQVEAARAGEVADDAAKSDPAVACAYDEERHRVMSCLDESQRKVVMGLSEDAQRDIVEKWDDWSPEKRKEFLALCESQKSDKAEDERHPDSARRGKV